MPSRSALETLVDQLATPIVQLDAQARIVYVNAAFASWVGLSTRRFVDHGLDAFGEAEAALATLVHRTLRDREPVRAHRLRVAPMADRERFADVWLSPATDGGVVLEFHPVEEFPGADPATDVPAALHETLKGLAHEIRNPLAGIRGAAQLLAKHVRDPDVAPYLDVIGSETDRLGALVENVLSPQPTRPHASVNVHEVLERVRLLAEADAGWSVLIHRDYDPSLPAVRGDADRLTQAIWNLVRNALQSGSSEVRLRTRAETHVLIGERPIRLALRIEVADNGRGVPEELATRLFMPLVTGRADGTGLGLTMAQAAAREHRGSLSFRSRPGHTVFTLLLPADDDPAPPTRPA
jgi:two-component system nitrogen regulation sensor histidine kinase GlnL